MCCMTVSRFLFSSSRPIMIPSRLIIDGASSSCSLSLSALNVSA